MKFRDLTKYEKEMKKQNKKSSLSKNGKTPGEIARPPLIISPLAGNSLTLLMKEVCRKFAKVLMRGGKKMSREIKSNPLRVGGCDRNVCMVCMTRGRGDCSRSGAGYRILCVECQKLKLVTTYEGETARNPYSRGLEHQKSLENQKDASPLWKHCTIQHDGRMVQFRMDALRPFRYPMSRQVNEGARVRVSKSDICMNSKSEFHQPGIVRIVAVRGNINEEQTSISLLAGRGGGRGRGRAANRRSWRGGGLAGRRGTGITGQGD